MFKYILKALLFFSPLLILLAVTEYKARTMPNNFAVKHEITEQNIDRAEIIIAGSSHAYLGIEPKMLGVPAVSIAYAGQDLYYDSRILLKYLPRANRAKLVVVTVSYISFEYLKKDSVGGKQTAFYQRFWEIPPPTPGFKLADYSAIALYGLQPSRYYLLTGKPSIMEVMDDSGGSVVERGTDLYNVMHGEIAVKRHDAELKEKYIAQNRQYLDELFTDLKLRNIQAVLVTTPNFHTYYDNLNPERYLRMQNEIQTLQQKYGLEYYNYMKDEQFVAEDFGDSDHLNTQGAKKFSRILKDEVIEKYISTP